MKNVFEQDLAEKRQKVQLIKSGQFTRKDKDGTDKGFVFLNPKAELRQSYLSTRDCLLDQGNGSNHIDNHNNLPTPPSLSLESTWSSTTTSVHSHGSSDQHMMGSSHNSHAHSHHHHNNGPMTSNTISTINTKTKKTHTMMTSKPMTMSSTAATVDGEVVSDDDGVATKSINKETTVVIDVPANNHHYHPIIREIQMYPATAISPIKTQASPMGYTVNSAGHGSPMMYHTTPPVANTSMTADLTYALSPRAFETKSFSTEQLQHQQQSLQPPSSAAGQQQGDVPSALASLGLSTALTNWFRRGHVTHEDPHPGNSNAEQHLGTPERKQQLSSGKGSKSHAIPRVSMTVSPTAYDNDDSMEHEELGVEEDKKEVDTEMEKFDNRYNPVTTKPMATAGNNTATTGGVVSGTVIGQGRRQSYAALLREQRAASIRSAVPTSTNKPTSSTSR